MLGGYHYSFDDCSCYIIVALCLVLISSHVTNRSDSLYKRQVLYLPLFCFVSLISEKKLKDIGDSSRGQLPA